MKRVGGGRAAGADLPGGRRLDHRLERAWRRELVRLDRERLAALRARAGAVVVAASTSGAGAVLVLDDGTEVRLGPCAPAAALTVTQAVGRAPARTAAPEPTPTPAVTRAVGRAEVRLRGVARVGRTWVLDLTGPDGSLPLVAGAVRLTTDGGGRLVGAAPGPVAVGR